MFNSYARCRSRVYPPSSFEKLTERERASKKEHWKEETNASLELEHIYGSSGIPSTIINVDEVHHIAFAASAAVVVWDLSNRISTPNISNSSNSPKTANTANVESKRQYNQRIFTSHQDEVTCLCSRSNIIASSELGFQPKILVWNCTTLKVIAPMTLLLERSVSCQAIAFVDARILVALTNDQNHSVSVVDWRAGIILTDARSGPSLGYGILRHCIHVGNRSSIVTNGKRHVRFWTYDHEENALVSNSTSTSSDVHCIISSKILKMW